MEYSARSVLTALGCGLFVAHLLTPEVLPFWFQNLFLIVQSMFPALPHSPA